MDAMKQCYTLCVLTVFLKLNPSSKLNIMPNKVCSDISCLECT